MCTLHHPFRYPFRPFPALCLLAVFLAVASGCSSRVSTDAIRSEIASGSLQALEEELQEAHEDHSEFVTACNLARVYQLSGRWADSIRLFNEALVILEEYESRAEISVRAILASAGTILFSRGADEYYGVGYERSLIHTFNALNYLMLGDFSGAAVEMRRMDKRQEIWLEESQARIEKYLETKRRLDSPDNLPVGYSMRDLLRDHAVRSLINNYQDPFSYSLGAVLYRLAGDAQAADVSMRRAMALNDDAERLFAAAWPGKATSRPRKESLPAVPEMPRPYALMDETTPPKTRTKEHEPDTQEVTVIAFSGLVPALRVENVRMAFPAIGYILVDLPAYARPVFGAKPMVSIADGREDGGTTLELHPLLRTDLLAYRTLWDEVSMELTFAISRAVTRAGVSATTYAAARSNKDTREYASLISTLTTILMDIFASSMAESVRNWETLPNTGYLALTAVARGSTVTVSVGGDRASVHLPHDARGVIILATELSNSNVKVNHVTY